MNFEAFTRRRFLRSAVGGFTAFALNNQFGSLFAAQATRKPHAVIVLWLDGGPSHIDTFDPKPGRATGGEFRTIETAIRGVSFSEHLPRTAAMARDLTLIRSLQTVESDHTRGTYLMHTGYSPEASLVHPSIGSVVSLEKSNGTGLPNYVVLGQMNTAPTVGRSPGFLNQEHAPFAITDPTKPGEVLAVLNPEVIRRSRLAKRLDQRFVSRHDSLNIVKRNRYFGLAEQLRGTAFEDALDLSSEAEETLNLYVGDNFNKVLNVPGNQSSGESFGYGCLLARRLIERGVRFVEVGLNGWDTHQDNFATTRTLCQVLDPAFHGLVQDLKRRGMMDSTLVVCMGEFGRTPEITDGKGRGHWSDAFSVALAGGPVPGGTVVGETDRDGAEVRQDPVTVPELFALIYRFMGIDPEKRFEMADSRLVYYTEVNVKR